MMAKNFLINPKIKICTRPFKRTSSFLDDRKAEGIGHLDEKYDANWIERELEKDIRKKQYNK